MKRARISLLLAWAALDRHHHIAVDAWAQRRPCRRAYRASSVAKKAVVGYNSASSRASCISRKDMIRQIGMLAVTITQQPVHAACLAGDASPDCIGVYKIPLDDGSEKYMDSPEKLVKFAPDVRWVPPVQYPKSTKAAIKELKELQESSLPRVSEFVLRGELQEAGVLLLKMTPRVTVAGKVVTQSLDKSANLKDGTRDRAKSIQAHRVELALDDLLSKLGETDIMIGQAIAGNMGASAPAQIQILAELKEAKTFFEDLFRYIV